MGRTGFDATSHSGKRAVCALAGATATLLASACATLVDEGHARECRSVVAAIEAPDAKITILRSAVGEAANSVSVDYRLVRASTSQLRHVVCRFGEANAEPG
ncbi:MAG: hypothetical protein JOY97_04135, partial [Hyphomicrobiales bacterium]|nr:hypothetical protein [Hyphomicrobiales bacterium]